MQLLEQNNLGRGLTDHVHYGQQPLHDGAEEYGDNPVLLLTEEQPCMRGQVR